MRLLLTGAGEPGFNMALDEALAIAVRRRWSPPTLRIYRWQSPAISLGCHQPLSALQGFTDAAPPAVAVVRRPTAGGAVAHADDVSYALVCGAPSLRGRPGRTLYAQFHAALGRALATGRSAGRYALYQAPSSHPSPAPSPLQGRGGGMRDERMNGEGGCAAFGFCFRQPVAGDLMLGARKVAGAAQRRWRDGLLQQGTIAADGHSPDRVALSIRTAWADVFQHRFAVDALTVQERVLADELWSKYRPWTPSSWPPVIPSASNRSH
ncbi:MAG: hypothetical protein HY600_05160 [Candidatus Omnitrophica bacterium]|nr:hypothetical protein [Candidatus Omnitrophota bacterium]